MQQKILSVQIEIGFDYNNSSFIEIPIPSKVSQEIITKLKAAKNEK